MLMMYASILLIIVNKEFENNKEITVLCTKIYEQIDLVYIMLTSRKFTLSWKSNIKLINEWYSPFALSLVPRSNGPLYN